MINHPNLLPRVFRSSDRLPERPAGIMTAVDSPEKILFASTTQAFLQKEAPLRPRPGAACRGCVLRSGMVAARCGAGWTGLLVPEELGGGSVSEQRCRGSGHGRRTTRQDGGARAAVSGQRRAGGPGRLRGPRKSHAATIESLMSGETVASWAVCEPGRGWAPLDPSVTATPTDSGYRIDGTKDRVEAGAQSAMLLVVTRCGSNASEVRQFLVPTDAPGVRDRSPAVGRPGQAIRAGAIRRRGRGALPRPWAAPPRPPR